MPSQCQCWTRNNTTHLMCQIQEVETLLAGFSKVSYVTNLYLGVNLDFPPKVYIGSCYSTSLQASIPSHSIIS